MKKLVFKGYFTKLIDNFRNMVINKINIVYIFIYNSNI